MATKDYIIAPSILSADFSRLGEEVNSVLEAGADWVHFDVMDNHYVPNLTIGPMVCQSLRDYGITAPIDVHLMVEPVDQLIKSFSKAGATYITFHPEASDDVDRSLNLIKDSGCKAGLVLNPDIPIEVLDGFLDKLDMILLMSVFPGFGGQEFIDSVLEKVTKMRSIINEKQNDVRFYLGPNFHVVTYPVDDNKTSFVGAFKRLKSTEESWRTLGNYHELRSDIPGYILDKYPSIKHNKEIFKWGVYTRTDMGNMYMDNITFLGDAAHPIVPFMGQGGCLAIEDSYIFGKLLIKYRNDIKKSQSIYHDIRYSRVKKIRDDSLNQATFNHLKNPLLIYIRNLLMKYTNIIHILTKKVWDYDPKKEIANINNQ